MPTARSSAASRRVAARLLQGKHKPTYTPFIDTGDHVVVVNAAKVKLTGRKEDQKIYRQHSGYEGGLREERARLVRAAQARAAGRRRGARHAAQDEDGRSDVSQVESVRRSGSPARGAETLQARGRVTWQQRNTTEPAGARRRPPACSSGPAPGPSASTTARSTRSSPPKRCARRFARRWCSPRPPTSSTSWRRSPAAACRDRPARCGSASRARSSSYNLELRKTLKDEGLLTRDARAKERKKYGMAGARKRFQFSKR